MIHDFNRFCSRDIVTYNKDVNHGLKKLVLDLLNLMIMFNLLRHVLILPNFTNEFRYKVVGKER